jgi:hypothetical protein
MAFVVEDGTGLDDANSGAGVGDADIYFRDRGIAAWTGTSTVKQGALIRATDYIEMRFSTRFKGEKEFPDVQALSFPRLDDNLESIGVPVAYQRAIFEYALRTIDGTPLAPDATIPESGISLLSESHKVGPIEDTYRYASKGAGSVVRAFRTYPSADAWLKELLISGTGVTR